MKTLPCRSDQEEELKILLEGDNYLESSRIRESKSDENRWKRSEIEVAARDNESGRIVFNAYELRQISRLIILDISACDEGHGPVANPADGPSVEGDPDELGIMWLEQIDPLWRPHVCDCAACYLIPSCFKFLDSWRFILLLFRQILLDQLLIVSERNTPLVFVQSTERVDNDSDSNEDDSDENDSNFSDDFENSEFESDDIQFDENIDDDIEWVGHSLSKEGKVPPPNKVLEHHKAIKEKRKAGRPKSHARRLEKDEIDTKKYGLKQHGCTYTCSNCGEKGHNKKGCSKSANVAAPTTSTSTLRSKLPVRGVDEQAVI
ncbi:hypothetical protein KSP39_PZI022043 [Platanthera zijinensis]|uniref:CCHC-type domain-containing protein n=1 Tax=Platanthera zijinensis TaxID=2320716 RepID=A0AAP0AY05_9ASPA